MSYNRTIEQPICTETGFKTTLRVALFAFWLLILIVPPSKAQTKQPSDSALQEPAPDFTGIEYYNSDTFIFEFWAVQVRARFIGGDRMMHRFIDDNLEIPDSVEIPNSVPVPRVIVTFVIERDGRVTGTCVSQHSRRTIPELELAAIDVVNKTSGMWTPAYRQDRPRRMQFTLPIRFKKMVQEKPEPDHLAKFKGGREAMNEFIRENLPKTRKGNDALANIKFTIEEDGQITNVELDRLHFLSDKQMKQAIEIVRKMSGKWEPAFQESEKGNYAVSSTKTIAILFEHKSRRK